MCVSSTELVYRAILLIDHRFIEENNEYKNKQKRIQLNQRMPPGMPSQDMMAFWGMPFVFSKNDRKASRY